MVRGFIFDLDGTIYLDDEIIEGSAEVIQFLRERGDKVVFLTNKSISTRHDYVIKLNNMGIDVNLEEIINSNYITAKYLKENMTNTDTAFVIGEAPLLEELQWENIRITSDSCQASFMVLGWDRKFNYEKLNHVYQGWLRNNATILATNPDRTCPVYGGQIPDCGAMIGAVEGATGQPIDLVIGKPSYFAAKFVVDNVLKLKPSQCFMVGDRLETDIRMGNDNGLKTVLVLTGITEEGMLKDSVYKPTYTMESVKGILQLERNQ